MKPKVNHDIILKKRMESLVYLNKKKSPFLSLLSTISSFHSFVVWNKYPFSLLVKFKLWSNLTTFKQNFYHLPATHPLFVFDDPHIKPRNRAKKSIVPGPSGNTKLAIKREGGRWGYFPYILLNEISQLAKRSAREVLTADLCTDHAHYVKKP